ncbi:MAG: hypothetical protein VCF24_00240 [Candidatus Latescibacterota bacterium]
MERTRSWSTGCAERLGAGLLALLAGPVAAEEIRFDSAADWRGWQIPLGIVELAADGVIRPVEIRKNINAALNATALGGGVYRVGSNPLQAPSLFDADRTTGWAPDASSPAADWFVEIDLGRAVSAHSVTLQFDEQAPPFELFELQLSTGEQYLDLVGIPIEGTLVYRIRERYKANNRHRLTFELDDPLHTPIRFVRVQSLTHVPGARLTEIEVTGFGDNLLTNLLDKGGDIEIVTAVELGSDPVTIGNAFSLVDGDLITRYSQRNEPRAAQDIHGHITIDLGAVYWVDMVRIIGGVVVRSGIGGRITEYRYSSRRSFIYRFYEILTSDGSLSPDGTRVWAKHFSDWASDEMKRRGLADHMFDPIPARFLRFRWRVWDVGCAFGADVGGQVFMARNCLVSGYTEELQAFGEGFPREVSLRSPLIDLEQGKNLNVVRWLADTPPGTRVEVRTRTGNRVEQVLIFRDKNGKQVTERAWGKLIPSFRGLVDTTLEPSADWSPWSKTYAASGERFQSPSPRRFMEVDVRLVTDSPDRAPTLDWLAVDFSPPLAGRAVGEITPSQVRPGEMTEFTYFLLSEDSPNGFDRVSVEASTALEFVDTRVDGESVVGATATATEKGFDVAYPRPVRGDQLVALRFLTTVFLQSTRFDVFLEDGRSLEPIRQRVDPGDATADVVSNSNVVRIPVSGRLFADIDITPAVLTPNADGVNDELAIDVKLVNVLSLRPLGLRVYDLSGRLLFEDRQMVTAGRHALTWDGRADGRPVPPGLHLVEVYVEVDASDQRVRRVLPVAY